MRAGADGIQHRHAGDRGGVALALELELLVVDADRGVGREDQLQVNGLRASAARERGGENQATNQQVPHREPPLRFRRRRPTRPASAAFLYVTRFPPSAYGRCRDGSPRERSQGIKREHGARPRGRNAVAAPATVSGEPVASDTTGKPGRSATGGDPRARRPAIASGFRVRRAGSADDQSPRLRRSHAARFASTKVRGASSMQSFLASVLSDHAGDLRSRIVGLYVLLIALNLAAWAWAFWALHDYPVLLGTAVL